MRGNRVIGLALGLGVFLFSGIVYAADVPAQMSYQGFVKVNGSAFNGSGSFRFAIVNLAGDTTYWSNDGTSTAGSEPAAAVSSTVIDGVVNIILGDTNLTNMTALPKDIFSNGVELYLRVWFDDGTTGSERITPDRKITASAYAMNCDAFDNTIMTSLTLDSDNTSSGANVEIIANQGSDDNGVLRYNATTNAWQYSNDGTTYNSFGNFSADGTTPMTGDLDVGDNDITSAADIALDTISGNSNAITIGDGADTVTVNPTTAVSFSDKNISNVGDIAVDTISADGSSFTISDDWTNADNTVANLGTVTTADINGGSIDAITLGIDSPVTNAQIDNMNFNASTITWSTATAGVLTATAGQNIAIETVTFDGGVVTGIASVASTNDITITTGSSGDITLNPNGTGSITPLGEETGDDSLQDYVSKVYRYAWEHNDTSGKNLQISDALTDEMTIVDVWMKVITAEGVAMLATLRTLADGGGKAISSALNCNSTTLVRTTALADNELAVDGTLYLYFSDDPQTTAGVLYIEAILEE